MKRFQILLFRCVHYWKVAVPVPHRAQLLHRFPPSPRSPSEAEPEVPVLDILEPTTGPVLSRAVEHHTRLRRPTPNFAGCSISMSRDLATVIGKLCAS